jgi:hypothetical protein
LTARFPNDTNGRVLRSMQQSGADMTAKYAVDFEHVFANLDGAKDFEQRIVVKEYRTELSEYDGASGYYWQVRVIVRMVPTHSKITRMEMELATLAEACGGRSDGWGILH